MSIVDKIKDFFLKRNKKALPEANSNYRNNQDNQGRIDNSYLISGYGNVQAQPTKLDIDIENFLTAYYNKLMEKIKLGQPVNISKTAYTSLINSNETITNEKYKYNSYKENILLNNLKEKSQYQVVKEGGFYHVRPYNYKMPDFQDMARVYVNCKSENIADLANTIFEYNQNPNFYMKVTSNQANAKCPRNEKMVIYCHKNEVDYNIKLLQYCKGIRPELFEGSKSTLPFLKSEEDIATVAFQPTTDQYKNLYGQTKTIPQSVNYYVSNMLEESYVESVREIAREDSKLGFLFDQNNYNNEALYIYNYPYIAANYKDYLLNSMKSKLEVLSRTNNIQIEGLSQNNQYDRNNNAYDRNYNGSER